jgi:hypothetical protein
MNEVGQKPVSRRRKHYLFGPWIVADVYTEKWCWFRIRGILTTAMIEKRRETLN